MEIFSRPHLLIILLLLLLGNSCTMFGPSKPVERTDNPEIRTGFFTTTSKSTPQQQWDYALAREKAGNLSKAARAFRNLMYQWPDDPLAAPAQQRRAELNARMNKPTEAFKNYLFLLERYPDRIDYTKTLDSMIAIAKSEEERIRGKFLFLPGFKDPVQALSLYRDLIKNAPRHPKASKCLLRIAEINHEDQEYEAAIQACNELIATYPNCPEEQQAVFQKVLSSQAVALEKRNDDQAARAARAAAIFYLDRYPESENATEARQIATQMFDRLARAQWKRATYYDTIAKKPKAALLAYQKLVQQFPVSEWTPPAEARIKKLNLLLEPQATTP